MKHESEDNTNYSSKWVTMGTNRESEAVLRRSSSSLSSSSSHKNAQKVELGTLSTISRNKSMHELETIKESHGSNSSSCSRPIEKDKELPASEARVKE